MKKGSIVKLAKDFPKGDKKLAKHLGHDLPLRDVYYTVQEVKMMYCYIQHYRVPTVVLDEIKGEFDPGYFVEVQEPMKIDLTELLT